MSLYALGGLFERFPEARRFGEATSSLSELSKGLVVSLGVRAYGVGRWLGREVFENGKQDFPNDRRVLASYLQKNGSVSEKRCLRRLCCSGTARRIRKDTFARARASAREEC